MKLLFVDDDPNIINIFKKWASLKGYDAEFAQDGIEVLDLVKTKKFDLILLDIDMPILDGITTARKLEELSPQTKVLILTGLLPQSENLPHNIIDILLKPITLTELGKRISLIINSC